ncbi:MAG TPA: glycoside hydrolase family 3 protein, partial [Microbacteriaceae bacterium]|nr:glycoside hydrolase family 3 protein [Microbacteriaceae bacterium]
MRIPENIRRTLDTLTRQQKVSLTSGASFWRTKPVPEASVPALVLTDGPHGVRMQAGDGEHLGLTESVPATCFPPAAALASSWDPALVRRVGEALGEEARAEGVQVLLGPGINIKRSPLCGRNFEYLSEDPYVAGVLGAALVQGIQQRGVAASLKHFAANNQETDRLRVSADVDERTLREVYLRGFQRVVAKARPWTVMCSYNGINGVRVSEDRWLLTTVLRDEWGFDGLVVSDWGAVVDRAAALEAGVDLEMPSRAAADMELTAALDAGRVSEAALDQAAARVLTLIERTTPAAGSSSPDADGYDRVAHHALARETAARCVVLLKNEGDLLPLDPDTNVAVIGEFARTPRYQGSGSSQVVPTRLDTALDEIRRIAGRDVPFAPGFALPGAPTGDGGPTAGGASAGGSLLDEAVAVARAAETVVLFLGLPASDESEGFDREHLNLPPEQTALLDAVLAVNSTVIVVLANGGVVRVSGWDERVPAILEGWLLGQAGGGAIADILFGRVEPSGRLAETIPARLEDTPAYLNFPGENYHVRYGEGLFVGYRWYDARDLAVSYPFGHGLSYTQFDYGDVVVEAVGSGDTVAPTGVAGSAEAVGSAEVAGPGGPAEPGDAVPPAGGAGADGL